MRTVEQYWQDFEKFGFVKSLIPGGVKYSLPPELGEGGFELLGDTETCMACISDVVFYKPCVIFESVREKMLEFGQFYAGEVSFYQKREDVYPIAHGLNFWVNHPFLSGYKRMEANTRLINVGFAYREKFFDHLPYTLPDDFWETAASVLNLGILTIPSIMLICEQMKNCRLSEMAIKIFVEGKALEAFAIVLDYIYEHRKAPAVHLSAYDREALEKAKALLCENISNPPAVKELARASGMNQQKLMSGFKYVNGTTIYGYLKRVRMNKAVELLCESDISVSEIARIVGYHGDGHFQKAFRDAYGTTPSKLRKEITESVPGNNAH